ncbi:MAG: hypothetical protein IIW36_03595 [Clostridia bacterium]|nr:hypothetical protein [Clostridia bacterium]
MNFRPNPLLYGANMDFFSTFRLAIRMRSTVDYDVLSRSVARAMARYPYFCVSPEREGEELVLRYNERPLPVFPDDRTVRLGSEESRGHLLSFGCKDNTIFLDASHYLADGMGIDPLMKTLLYSYVSERYGTEACTRNGSVCPTVPFARRSTLTPFRAARWIRGSYPFFRRHPPRCMAWIPMRLIEKAFTLTICTSRRRQ